MLSDTKVWPQVGQVQRRLDHETDLAAGARLGRGNAVLDSLHGLGGKTPPRARMRGGQVTQDARDFHG